MKRVKKRRKNNIFVYAERQKKNIEYVQLHEHYTMCGWRGQIREEECIRSHVHDVLAGDSSSRVLKLLPFRRPVSGADVETSVDVVPHCIQYNEGAKPRDDGE